MGFKNFTAIVAVLVGVVFLMQTLGMITGIEKIWPIFMILWGLGVLFGREGIHTIPDYQRPEKPIVPTKRARVRE